VCPHAASVNRISLTREAWRAVAARAAVKTLEVEIICSDPEEHRRRVDTRTSTVANLRLPTWQEVVERGYEPWSGPQLVIDTATQGVDDAAQAVRTALRQF
jgi:hypothetical protein